MARYCKAFGAEVTFAIKNQDQTAYEHCELSVHGDPILAVAEASKPYDVSVIHQLKWETMTFNAFELGSVKAALSSKKSMNCRGASAALP